MKPPVSEWGALEYSGQQGTRTFALPLFHPENEIPGILRLVVPRQFGALMTFELPGRAEERGFLRVEFLANTVVTIDTFHRGIGCAGSIVAKAEREYVLSVAKVEALRPFTM